MQVYLCFVLELPDGLEPLPETLELFLVGLCTQQQTEPLAASLVQPLLIQVYLAANAPVHRTQAVSVTSTAQRILSQIVFFMVKSFLSCVAFYLWHLLSEVVTAKIIRTKVV